MYIHEQAEWPHFIWNEAQLSRPLADLRFRQGRLVGRMESLGFSLRNSASFRVLTDDVFKTSEIEGDLLDIEQVRSSLAQRLGIDIGALAPTDHHVDGVVEMMLDATQRYDQSLTAERLWGWQAALFPGGWSSSGRLTIGAWRTEPMSVISGTLERQRVHFEAPAADRVPAEMERFLTWFQRSEPLDPVLKAAVAHLWFVTIHPFDDGNGRIARAITDLQLARSERSPQRFYSVSAQIRLERDTYYRRLESTQKGGLDLTNWVLWFVACLERAVDAAESTLGSVLVRARFWDGLEGKPVNDRQRKMFNIIFAGAGGRITTSRWAKITNSSQDTAQRDITDLIARGLFVKDSEGGRSTSYSLVERE